VRAAGTPTGGGETDLASYHTADGELVAVGFISLDRLIDPQPGQGAAREDLYQCTGRASQVIARSVCTALKECLGRP
jgi:hypothetical protein